MTGWSEVITESAMLVIDDERWQEELRNNPAQFFRAKSQYVKYAMGMLTRPVELANYIQNRTVLPLFSDSVWVSTEESTHGATVLELEKKGYDLCTVSVRSDDGTYYLRYDTASYDSETGNITFPKQDREGIEYSIDFYADGIFPTLTPMVMRILGMAIAVAWDERFERNWLNMQPKIKDSSFETVNESNFIDKNDQRLMRHRQDFNDALKEFEQSCEYGKEVLGNTLFAGDEDIFNTRKEGERPFFVKI